MTSDLVYSRAQAAILPSSGHSVKENAKLTERWVNKWSKRECFDDKPRSGRPSVLINNYCPRNSIEKANNKPSNLTRKIAKNLQPKNIEVYSITVWIHDQERMEGFQAKENTFVEREAKESPFAIRQKYAKLRAEGWNSFFLFTDECPKYIF